jgi:hypothetical protein
MQIEASHSSDATSLRTMLLLLYSEAVRQGRRLRHARRARRRSRRIATPSVLRNDAVSTLPSDRGDFASGDLKVGIVVCAHDDMNIR